MLCLEQVDVLNNLPEVLINFKKLDSSRKVYFTALIPNDIKATLKEKMGLDLFLINDVPMTWLLGDTSPHIDIGISAFSKTHLVYLTDSEGQLVVNGESHEIKRGKGIVFAEGLFHETVNTGLTPRLLLGPISEQGFRVGNSGLVFVRNWSEIDSINTYISTLDNDFNTLLKSITTLNTPFVNADLFFNINSFTIPLNSTVASTPTPKGGGSSLFDIFTNWRIGTIITGSTSTGGDYDHQNSIIPIPYEIINRIFTNGSINILQSLSDYNIFLYPALEDISSFNTNSITPSSINCNWTSIGTPTSYNIYISTTIGTFTTPIIISSTNNSNSFVNSSYTFSGLTPATDYYFQIVSITSGSWSIPRTTIAKTSSPPRPSNFVISEITSTSIRCNWTAVLSADSYILYISSISGPFSASIAISRNVITYLFSGLDKGSHYYFRIVSVTDGISSSPATTDAATTAIKIKQIKLNALSDIYRGPPIPISLTYPGISTLSISIAKKILQDTFVKVRLTVINAAKNNVVTLPNKKLQRTVSGSINISFNLFTVGSGNLITFDKIQLEGSKNNKWYTLGYCLKVSYIIP